LTVALTRLLELAIITLSKGTRTYVTLQRLVTCSDLLPPCLYSNASFSTIVNMTRDGIGVSVIPTAVIAEELQDGHLKLIKTEIALPRAFDEKVESMIVDSHDGANRIQDGQRGQ
jgi:DNA-binding transcriptional LysR family regulator